MNFKKYFYEEDKKYRNLILLLSVIIIAVSSILALTNGDYFLLGDVAKLNNDDVRYLNTSRVLLNEGKLIYYGTNPTTFIMPLFPIFLSGVMAIFGTGEGGTLAIRIIQAFMQGLSLYLVYLLGRELFNKKIGAIAAILTALYLPEYMVPNLILTEVLFKLLFISLFYFAIIAIKENKMLPYVITSFLWGLTSLIRPNVASFPLFIIIFWIVYKYKFKDMCKYTFVAFIAFTICFAPWWIRNVNLRGEFFLFTESSANPKLIGAFIFNAEPSFKNEIDPEYQDLYDRRIAKKYMSEAEQDKLGNYLIKTGFEKEPLKYATWYSLGKTYTMYKEPYYWRPVLGISKPIMYTWHAVIVLTSIAGIILMFFKKNRSKSNGMLLTLLAISTVTYWPFVAFSRYGYPNMFMIILLASYAVHQILPLANKYKSKLLKK
ncbi:MAG: ArnT family glycosyltransferase [Sarcina sp.]